MTEKAKKVLEIRVYTCIKIGHYSALNPYIFIMRLIIAAYDTYTNGQLAQRNDYRKTLKRQRGS